MNSTQTFADLGFIQGLLFVKFCNKWTKNLLGALNIEDAAVTKFSSEEELQKFLEQIKNNEIIAGASIQHKKDEEITTKAIDEDGNETDLITQHAYAIIGADDKYVYIVNPHRSLETLKISHEDFKRTFNSFDIVNRSDVIDANPDLIIDGGTLPGITVDGKAGENVIVKDGKTFIAITDDSGSVTYRVQDREGSVSYISTEVFEKLIKNAKDEDVNKILKEHSVKDSQKVSEEILGHDWTEEEKQTALVNLKLAYGLDYNYNIAYNFDGTINFTAFDKDGNIVVSKNDFDYLENVGEEELQGHNWTDNEKNNMLTSLQTTFGKNYNYSIAYNFDGSISYAVLDKEGNIIFGDENFDPRKPLIPDGKDLEEIKNIFKDMANKNANKHKENPFNEWDTTLGSWIIKKYSTGNGNQLDTNAMIKDWAKNGGEVYTYTNNGDGTFSFSEGYKYGNEDHYYTGGFDVFSIGGNPYGGGIVYNEYGQIDWKNSTFSLFGGGGGGVGVDDSVQRRDKDLNKNCQVKMQVREEL